MNTIWTGSGYWDVGGNWSAGVPGVGDTAVFGASLAACTIRTNVSVAAIVGGVAVQVTVQGGNTVTAGYIDTTTVFSVQSGAKIVTGSYPNGTLWILPTSKGEVDVTMSPTGNYNIWNNSSNPTAGPLSAFVMAGSTGSYKLNARINIASIDATGINGTFRLTCGTTGLGRIFTCPSGCTVAMPSTQSWLHVDHDDASNGGTIVAPGGTNDGNNLNWSFPLIPAPVITSPLTAQAFVTRAFSYQITATNSPTSYDATGLPVWASINTGTGLISGTPTTAGSTSVVISATNSAGTGSATLVITAYVKNPFLTQRKQVAVKIETTESTDAAPADADCIAPIYKPEWSPSIKMLDRTSVLASFSKLPQVASERSAVIKFECELKGSGTAGTPPAFASALKACGWGETIVTSTSVTYAPISASVPSVTVEIREGSDTVWKSKKITGARGTCSITAENGNAVKIVFTFTGKYVEPTDTVQFTQAAIGTTPPIFAGVTLVTVGVGSLKARQFSFDLGNKVVLKPDSTVSGGYYSALITDRKPTGSIDPEQETVDVVNYPSDITAAYQDVLSWSIGSSSGNRVAFSSPKCQIVSLSDSDRSGIRVENLSLAFGQNALTGNDEVSLAFT